jgi:hypothetical protein
MVNKKEISQAEGIGWSGKASFRRQHLLIVKLT